MDTCLHRAEPDSYRDHGWDRVGLCAKCGQQIRSFYVDDEEDRRGGWTRWKAVPFVIQEEQELSWSVSV